MIKFALATSWDNSLLFELGKLNAQYKDRKISELYGSLKTSLTGSGRPAYRLPEVSWEQLAEHIKCAHSHDIKFNYVMNAPDFQGKEQNKLWVKKLTQFLVRLDEASVDYLTITHHWLIELVKKEFSKFKIYLSLIAGVDTVEQAKKYEDMEVDVIHLNPHTVNRDFGMIKKIVKAVNIPVVLYANIPCLDHCPWRDDHYKFFGYASQIGNDSTAVTTDNFVTRCSLEYLDHPVQLLKSPFIRPEDITEYGKIGVHHFKLSDRSESTNFLIRTATAYLQGEYHDNLFSLIFRAGSKFKAGIKSKCPEFVNMSVPIIIDNDKLTQFDFLQKIKQLSGQKLENFYRLATEQCVAIGDVSKLKQLLKRGE